jgi:uncharacterized NAD(P)/FAD-binding protein YdhS
MNIIPEVGGLDTMLEGNAIARQGNEVPDLFIVGTLRKPALWESTAVPELRTQAAVVAERIIGQLARRAPENVRAAR